MYCDELGILLPPLMSRALNPLLSASILEDRVYENANIIMKVWEQTSSLQQNEKKYQIVTKFKSSSRSIYFLRFWMTWWMQTLH
jgi:hypothetical protein